MNAEIIAVGTELLIGQITNTNARYISSRLQDAGVNVYYHTVVGDNPGRLKDVLAVALSRADALILTGGLGPTQDDLTKNTVADAFGVGMKLDEESLKIIKGYFLAFGREMTPNNERQAYFPEGAEILRNSNGTAPGCMLEKDGKVIFMLPGPPSEMESMFEESVMPYFLKKSAHIIESKFVRIFGIGESAVEDKLMDLIDNQTNPTVATYAKDGEVTVRLTAKYERDKKNQDVISPVADIICQRFGKSVTNFDDLDIEDYTAQLLIKNGMTVSFAESCTGGLAAAKLTDHIGVSAIFAGGAVVYSNQMKTELLCVKPETLAAYGAVSKETALEMAVGIRMLTHSDISIAITGIAGPEGGTLEKPVGTVFIACSDYESDICREFHFSGKRSRIRNLAVKHAFNIIRLKLIGD